MLVGVYTVDMGFWYIVLCVAAIVWLLFVIGFVLYFYIRLMPAIREIKKTSAGQQAINKLMYPPRFPRN
jgi:hypothetical protein